MSAQGTLRVGFLAPGWAPDPGGVAAHTADLARELLCRRHAVAALVVARPGEGGQAHAVADDVVAGVAVRRMTPSWGGGDALAGLVRDERAEAVVRAWLDEARPDVVHVHHLTGFGAGALAVLAERAPVVLTLHDYWLACPRGQLLRHDGAVCAAPEPATCGACLAATWPGLLPSGGGRAAGPEGEPVADDAAAADARTRFALAALERCARVLVPSEGARDAWAAIGLDAARLEVRAPGLEAGWIAAEVARLRREFPRSRGGVALGVLGAVQPSKGVLELARAFSALDGDDRRLEVWGPLEPYHGDPSAVAALRALARGDHRVELRGSYGRAELPRVLARLDGVAVPSRWPEVFGLGAREARAAGLPVLASRVGGLAEAVRHDEEGLLVDADDVSGWAAALERFFGDADARARWSAAPARVPDLREAALELEELYRSCVAAGAVPRA